MNFFDKKNFSWQGIFAAKLIFHFASMQSSCSLKKTSPKTICARDGDRTHAHIRELDLKSNALTTRPPWLYLNKKYDRTSIWSLEKTKTMQ